MGDLTGVVIACCTCPCAKNTNIGLGDVSLLLVRKHGSTDLSDRAMANSISEGLKIWPAIM
jgi:hypothetical protein